MLTVVRNLLIVTVLLTLPATHAAAEEQDCVDQGGIYVLDPTVGETQLCEGWGCVWPTGDTCYSWVCDDLEQGGGVTCGSPD